jgi:hypothetical protein
MIRAKFDWLLLTVGLLVSPMLAQQSPVQEPSDLQVQFQSATGSTRFRVGEGIPLEVLVSSSTPNRYLEPCALFDESGFGYPRCRFLSQWSFALTPVDGLVDLGGRRWHSGPVSDVPNPDLTSTPVTFSYRLSSRYRIDKPGEYRVRLSMQIGLDDETTQLRVPRDPSVKPHSVSVTREIVLQIVPAESEWQAEIVRRGEEAYASPAPPDTDPPSENSLQYRQATLALCTLGTPAAVRVFARLIADGRNEVQSCLERSASRPTAIDEMQRLLVDPNIAVTLNFLNVLVNLVFNEEASRKGMGNLAHQEAADTERDALFASLPQKHGYAQYLSLLTVLGNPRRVRADDDAPAYQSPFPQPVIALTVTDFDRLPQESQDWLMQDAWDRVRSPLMLPVVRRKAETGDGPALVRWLELDPAPATAFMRREIVRPIPRFSSYYLRLAEISLPRQQRQIATNFIALTDEIDLARAATLLHRYATLAVLPEVVPFIDTQLTEWPCSIQLPVLAYLLKVSPEDAAPRVAQVLKIQPGASVCANTFLSDLGFLEPSPVLETLALSQVQSDGPSAVDGAHYLERYGSLAMKSKVWEQLQRWHEQFVSSGADRRFESTVATKNDTALGEIVRALTATFEGAQAWGLSPEEAARMEVLLGRETVSHLVCRFHCGASLGINPVPAAYEIRSRINEEWRQRESPMEYLNPLEQLRYSINQYWCAGPRALQRKILQFPKGSTFTFTFPEDFTARDRDEILLAAGLLQKHGFKVERASLMQARRLEGKKEEAGAK